MSPWHDSAALDGAQNALNKMKRAAARGTGCHLSADEIRSLSLTSIGQCWEEDDPRKGCATATNTNQPEDAKLECPKCGVDRAKQPCGSPNLSDCGMIGTAFLGAANTNKGGDRG